MPRAAVTYRNEKKIQPYLAALREAGVEPVRATPGCPLDSLHGCQGLLLAGGNDVDPARYGQSRHPQTDPDPERDALEFRLLGEALSSGLPVLAICRGMQLFNVAHGGTLHQHIQGHQVRGSDPSLAAHQVTVETGTRLAWILGEGPHGVNSRHHQAVDQPGTALVVSARAPDGVVEALEVPGARFAIAVQWHPEDMPSAAAQRELFRRFAESLTPRKGRHPTRSTPAPF
jgi:putative glutamine amidotransferase